jgi:phosphoglycolate phosphatase
LKRFARWVLRRAGKTSATVPRPSSRPKVLIFDFDGTLADTFQAGVEILNGMADEFRFRRLTDEDVMIVREMTIRQLIRHLGISSSKVPRISLRGVKEMRKRIDSIKPIEGVCSVVHELHRQGFLLGIVTSNSEENVSCFLRRHHIACFDFIRSSSRLLGKARVIRAVLREKKFKTHEALLIGDESRDIEAAKRTRVPIVAVTWGYNTATALAAQNPQYLMTHPRELLELMESGFAAADSN